MGVRLAPKRYRSPANDQSLVDEPEQEKALRLLRYLRHFIALKDGVTAIELDGDVLFIIKYNPGNHPHADTTTSSEI